MIDYHIYSVDKLDAKTNQWITERRYFHGLIEDDNNINLQEGFMTGKGKNRRWCNDEDKRDQFTQRNPVYVGTTQEPPFMHTTHERHYHSEDDDRYITEQ